MVFLHGDALGLPFRPSAFTTVLALNLLHAVSDATAALGSLRRALSYEGRLCCTTLVKTGRFSDAYLARLGRADLLVPRGIEDVRACFQRVDLDCEHSIAGNMATLRAVARAKVNHREDIR